MNLTLLAPAKINLYLEVLKKIPSQHLHNIETIMQTVSLFDLVSINCNKSNTKKNKIEIFTDCNCLNRLPKFKNLCYIAADSFFESNKIYGFSLSIKVKKKIPLNAGLAGGSSDAAAVLKGLNCIFKNTCDALFLEEIAKKIGTDVPFLLSGGTVVAKGVGTQIKKIKSLESFYVLICKPNFDIFTEKAYKKFDKKYEMESYENNGMDDIISAINVASIKLVAEKLYNRFEVVAQSSVVTFIKSFMKQNGALGALMSGTGSSVFGIFKEREKADKCKKVLKKSFKNVFLCEPINFGCKILGKN